MGTKRPWHDHYPEGVALWPEFEKITLSQTLGQTAADFPGSTALDFFGKKIAYRDLNGLVGRFARGLKNLGVVPGDRVALLLPNIPQVVIANFAIWRLGAVTAPANPLYTEREMLHQLNDSGATVLIALDLLMPRLDKVLPQTSIREVVVCHINDYLPFPKKWLVPLVKKDMVRAIPPRDHLYQYLSQ